MFMSAIKHVNNRHIKPLFAVVAQNMQLWFSGGRSIVLTLVALSSSRKEQAGQGRQTKVLDPSPLSESLHPIAISAHVASAQ